MSVATLAPSPRGFPWKQKDVGRSAWNQELRERGDFSPGESRTGLKNEAVFVNFEAAVGGSHCLQRDSIPQSLSS
jgi:hypothetical protein